MAAPPLASRYAPWLSGPTTCCSQNVRKSSGWRDIAAAEHAWAKALDLMADPTIRLVVLDELNIALRYDYLDLDAVVATFRARRPDLHVIVTGRNAKPALIEAADLVTEMTAVKHHFAAGVKAQEGIEF